MLTLSQARGGCKAYVMMVPCPSRSLLLCGLSQLEHHHKAEVPHIMTGDRRLPTCTLHQLRPALATATCIPACLFLSIRPRMCGRALTGFRGSDPTSFVRCSANHALRPSTTQKNEEISQLRTTRPERRHRVRAAFFGLWVDLWVEDRAQRPVSNNGPRPDPVIGHPELHDDPAAKGTGKERCRLTDQRRISVARPSCVLEEPSESSPLWRDQRTTQQLSRFCELPYRLET